MNCVYKIGMLVVKKRCTRLRYIPRMRLSGITERVCCRVLQCVMAALAAVAFGVVNEDYMAAFEEVKLAGLGAAVNVGSEARRDCDPVICVVWIV